MEKTDNRIVGIRIDPGDKSPGNNNKNINIKRQIKNPDNGSKQNVHRENNLSFDEIFTVTFCFYTEREGAVKPFPLSWSTTEIFDLLSKTR